MSDAIRANVRANTNVLYRFYDEADQLLYIGITNDPARRFSQHESDKPWWIKVANIKLQRGFANRLDLEAAEIAAIEAERPRYNRAHAAGVLETLRFNTGQPATSPWPDASRFHTEPVRDDYRQPRIRHNIPCPECGSPRVFQDADEHLEPIGDVRCQDCETTWTIEQWHARMLAL